MADRNKTLLLEILTLLLIVIIAIILRFPHLETNPGWYSDEGTLIDIASHLTRGETQYMAVKDSLLLFGRPPLFVNLLALVFKLFGVGILPLRTLTATLGVISVVVLYLVVRLCLGKQGFPLAALSALCLAVYPLSVIYSRIGYSYILLASMILLAILAAWKYANNGGPGWLVFGALMIGIGSLSDVMILTILPAYLIVVLLVRWKDIFITLGLVLLPLGIYAVIMLATFPDAFLFDLRSTLTRAEGFSLLSYIPALILNYGMFLRSDWWIIPGIIGIFLLKPTRFSQFIFLFFAVPLIVLGRSFIFAGLGYYYVSPLLPLIALGVASVILYGVPKVMAISMDALQFIIARLNPDHPNKKARRFISSLAKIGSLVFIGGLVVIPFAYLIGDQMYQMNHRIATPLDWILVDPDSGRAAINYANDHTNTTDLVIASPALAWALDCRTADFQMALAIDGIETEHLPANIDPARFAYDTHLEKASFVIYDPVWEKFGIRSIPAVRDMADIIRKNWTLVFEDGDVQIYKNPALIK